MAPLTTPGSPTSSNDRCPICKSLRFFTSNLTMLIEPTCYHAMCSSCVDRHFGSGPAPCPYAGCGARLRANRFRAQTFADIGVEREVDVRKRVTKVFNRRSEEFTDTREWDDYLEQVETLVFALLSGDRAERTEAEERLKTYETQHREGIRKNADRARAEAEAVWAAAEAEKAERNALREAQMKSTAAEKLEAEEGRRRQLEAMARGDLKEVERIKTEVAGRLEARREDAERETRRIREAKKSRELVLKGVMENGAASDLVEDDIVEEFQALGEGWTSMESSLDGTGREHYGNNAWIDDFVARPEVSAGGYMRDEWYERVVGEMFEGLTVFAADSRGELPEVTTNVEERIRQEVVGRTDVMIVDPVN